MRTVCVLGGHDLKMLCRDIGFRVIEPDLKSQGFEAFARALGTTDNDAKTIVVDFNELDIEKAFILGYSIGNLNSIVGIYSGSEPLPMLFNESSWVLKTKDGLKQLLTAMFEVPMYLDVSSGITRH